jgi:DNA-binding winged helix-turn-helix (wHTH) protein/tetratricopeptide (TPR) repeat protein
MDPDMRYRFGDFELDTDAFTLARAGRALHLRPKVFDVVRFLIERRGRVVTKQELIDALWGEEHVNEAVVPWTMSHARRALGQDGYDKQPIETIYRRGYCWNAEVEMIDAAPVEQARPDGAAGPGNASADLLPFVGRVELMDSLRARLTHAKAGRGGLCLLVGEPGIGKTRCMDELAASARDLGFSAWSGRAAEDRWAPPLWPWIQVLRAAAAERGARDGIGPLLARLRAAGVRSAAGEASAGAEPQPGRFMLIDSIARTLLHASRRRPLLVLLDDLHWADAATIDLIAAIAPELRGSALLIVASRRGGLESFRARRGPQLARYAEHIELQPLTTSDVGQYLRLITRSSAPDALSAAVHSATAGNALFMQETVRSLIAQHGVSGLLSLSSTDVRPPQLARDVLRERLAVLDERTRAVLLTASVLGERFDTDLLQRVSGLSADVLIGALDAGEREGLCSAEGAQHYRFCHALLQNVLYDELPARERIAAHRSAAVAIEQRAHILPRHGEIAHHYYRSLALGQPEAVTAASRRAAEEAERVGEFEDAATFCQWALEAQALDLAATPRQRGELLLLRARTVRHAGRAEDARAAVTQLVDVASRHGFADLLVRAARVLRPGRTWTSYNDPVARAALEETLRITRDDSDETRISALSQLASVSPLARDMQRSKEMSARAVELARKLGKPAVLAEALRGRLYALSGPDDIDAVREVAAEMLALDGEAESWIAIAAHSACYCSAIHRGDIAAADEALAALGRTARRQRRPEALWYHDRLRAQRRFIDGDFIGAESALAELESMRLSQRAWLFRIPQTLLALEREGGLETAAKWDLQAFLLRTNEREGEAASLARISVKVGRTDLARTVLERMAAGDFAGIPRDIGYLNALVNLSLVVIALGDRPRAESLYRLLAPYPHHNTPSTLLYYEGSVSHYLALLAEFLGLHERVEPHFDAALAMNESLGHKAQLARTYYEYARFLLPAGAGSRKRAEQMKARAIQLSAALGLSALESQARAL